MKKHILCRAMLPLLMLISTACSCANDSISVRVHFLHGSKPLKKYRHVEDQWFGGLLGGHAGIEYEQNRILNFQPKARFHIFAHRNIINSKFSIHDTISFYEILGGKADSAGKSIITIRISASEKKRLDSVASLYINRCPYDYAFFGMRCGAAAYNVLAETGVIKNYSFGKTWRKIFYPRLLRRKLEKLDGRNVTVRRYRGTVRRKWEAI